MVHDVFASVGDGLMLAGCVAALRGGGAFTGRVRNLGRDVRFNAVRNAHLAQEDVIPVSFSPSAPRGSERDATVLHAVHAAPTLTWTNCSTSANIFITLQ